MDATSLIISAITCIGILFTAWCAMASYRGSKRNLQLINFCPRKLQRENSTAIIDFEMADGEKSPWYITSMELTGPQKTNPNAGLFYKQGQAPSKEIKFDCPLYNGQFYTNKESLVTHETEAEIYLLHLKVVLIHRITGKKETLTPVPIHIYVN